MIGNNILISADFVAHLVEDEVEAYLTVALLTLNRRMNDAIYQCEDARWAFYRAEAGLS